MVYANPFHRVVIAGRLYGDVFATSLSMAPIEGDPAAPATQALADAVGAAVSTWWTRTAGSTKPAGPDLIGSALLEFVKVNRLDVDGRYMDNDPRTYTRTPLNGTGGNQYIAPQLAMVASLRGSDERGAASKGRMYFPPISPFAFLASDGRLTVAQATNFATAVVTLLESINATFQAQGFNSVASIASKTGAGRFQIVNRVTVGRVVDTVRSRRNKLLEAPVELTFDPTP